MKTTPNRSSTEALNAEDQWAKTAVRSMLDICGLNANLVAAGIFPTYIQHMSTTQELFEFKQFLDKLVSGNRYHIKVAK